MKNKLLKITINFIIIPLTAIILLYLAFKNIDINLFFEKLLKIKVEWVIFSLIIALTAMFFRGIRWKMLLEPFNYFPLNSTLFFSMIITYFANLAIPRFGEVARCLVLKKTDNIPVEISLGTVVVERIVDLISLFFILIVIFFSNIKLFENFFMINILSLINNSFIKLQIIMIILFLLFFFYFLFIKKKSNKRLIRKINDMVKKFLSGIKSIIKIKKLHLFVIYTVIIWFLYVLMTYIVFFSIEGTSHLTFYDSVLIMALGGIGMSLPVQSGFGTFHWMVVLGMSLLNVSRTDAMLYATITHESQVLMVLLLGPIVLVTIWLKYKKNNKNGYERLHTEKNLQ